MLDFSLTFRATRWIPGAGKVYEVLGGVGIEGPYPEWRRFDLATGSLEFHRRLGDAEFQATWDEIASVGNGVLAALSQFRGTGRGWDRISLLDRDGHVLSSVETAPAAVASRDQFGGDPRLVAGPGSADLTYYRGVGAPSTRFVIDGGVLKEIGDPANARLVRAASPVAKLERVKTITLGTPPTGSDLADIFSLVPLGDDRVGGVAARRRGVLLCHVRVRWPGASWADTPGPTAR